MEDPIVTECRALMAVDLAMKDLTIEQANRVLNWALVKFCVQPANAKEAKRQEELEMLRLAGGAKH